MIYGLLELEFCYNQIITAINPKFFRLQILP